MFYRSLLRIGELRREVANSESCLASSSMLTGPNKGQGHSNMKKILYRSLRSFGAKYVPSSAKATIKRTFKVGPLTDAGNLKSVRRTSQKNSTKPNRHITIADKGEVSQLCEIIAHECKTNQIPYFIGGSDWGGICRFNISGSDYRRFVYLIKGLPARKHKLLFVRNGKIYEDISRMGNLPQDFDIVLNCFQQRNVTKESFGPSLEVSVWGTSRNYKETRVTSHSDNALVSLSHSFHHAVAQLPKIQSIYKNNQRTESNDLEIDFVYTWVNDQDHVWAQEKDEWAAAYGKASDANSRALHKERFKNRDELKYSLRSVDMFAPWVRNIYIVTANQIPPWLNVNHPKIKMISHRDIYRKQEWLPTFNSSGIETQLHHIDGLSEYFVYLNDDVFFGRPSTKADLFFGNGVSRFHMSRSTTIPEIQNGAVEEYMQADINAINLFRERMQFSPSRIMEHVPHAARRSVLYEMERLFQDWFDGCAEQKFRSKKDLRPISFMYPHFAFHKGLAVPSSTTFRYLSLWRPSIVSLMLNVLKDRKYQYFCINDVGLPEEREEAVNEAVKDFLESYFPLPSEFELMQ